ncbi:hypothetical protein ACVW0J_002362 [Bradyrhizobium sp. i1.7.7]
MIENSVVSWPPCWVALAVKAPPTLPCSAPLAQEPAGLVQEVRHLRGHAAEAGAGADDDRIVIGEVLDLGDGRSLVDLVVRGLGDLGRHQLRHALDVDGGAGLARAFGDGMGHRFDVAIGGIIEDENFGHGGLRWDRC